MYNINVQSLPIRQRFSQQTQHSSSICRRPQPRNCLRCRAQSATATRGPVKESAGVSIQGTSRKRNEDRYVLQVCRDASLRREQASSCEVNNYRPRITFACTLCFLMLRDQSTNAPPWRRLMVTKRRCCMLECLMVTVSNEASTATSFDAMHSISYCTRPNDGHHRSKRYPPKVLQPRCLKRTPMASRRLRRWNSHIRMAAAESGEMDRQVLAGQEQLCRV